jgi:hypothetical protein
MTQWYLDPIFRSYLVVLVTTGLLALLLLIKPTYRSVGAGQRRVLYGLRLASILLLAVAMLRPTCVSTSMKKQSATLVLMFDASRSMQVADLPDGETRWKAQQDALQQVEPLLAKLSENLEVQIYHYDRGAQKVSFENGKIAFPEGAEGEMTDIGSAIDDVIRQEAGRRLAGVILLGDGAQRTFTPRVEMQQAVRELARLGYPLYTVGFGLDIDRQQALDVAIEGLHDHYTVFVKNELVLGAQNEVSLKVRGYVNRKIPVRLIVESPDGKTETVATHRMSATESGQQLPIRLSYTPEQPGQYRIILEAEEQPGELVTTNNRQTAFLTVLKGGLNVLYVEGSLQAEQKLMRHALRSSKDLNVQFRYVPLPGKNQTRTRWPLDFAKTFADPKIDVFVLGDVPAAAFTAESLTALAEAIEGGKGLLMLGGYYTYGPGRYQTTALGAAIPIRIGRLEKQDLQGPIIENLHLPGPLTMMPGRPHFITQLASVGKNDAVWRKLPPLLGANRFAGVKSTGTVLAKGPRDEPLLVSSDYGLGRVLAFAGDSTWQWVMAGQQREHKRFWRQMILWLARKDEAARKDVWIDLPLRRYNPEARVEFTAGANADDGEPIDDATFKATVTRPDGQKATVRLAADANAMLGSFEGTKQPGEYVIQVTAQQADQEIGSATVRFQVVDEDIELADPAADLAQLENLSEMTADAGGRRLAPAELSELLEQLRDSPPELEVEVQTRWQLGDRWFDTWGFFLVLVGLLSGEWYLRKKWGLV